MIKILERGFLLGLGLAGLIVAVAMAQMACYGGEVTLFEPPHSVSLFEDPVCLFPTEQTAAVSAKPESLILFEPNAVTRKIERSDFSRNHTAVHSAKGVFTLPRAIADAAIAVLKSVPKREPPKAPPVDPRPLMTCYGVPWCGACPGMADKVTKDDPRVRVKFVHGDPQTFPKCVREYGAAKGYPVMYWRSPKGEGALHHGVRSLDELAELVKTEPNEPPAQLSKR